MRWWGSKPELSDYEQRLVDDVAKHGWYCLSVLDGDDGEPRFTYTVGFWETLGAPELIIFGLDGRLCHSMLWEMFRQLEAGGELADGKRWSNLIEGFDCISRPVHPTQVKREILSSAMWYRSYRGVDEPIAVYQLFWPGAVDGLFPWEKGCDPAVRSWQPQLYLPDETGIA